MDELQAWLNGECEKAGMSWAEVSRRAGVAPNTVSAIMNGQRPGLEVCKSLASYFRVRPEYVLQLAGHIPPRPEPDIPRLQYLADRLQALSPEQRDRFMDMALMLLEFTDGQIPPAPSVLSGATTDERDDG